MCIYLCCVNAKTNFHSREKLICKTHSQLGYLMQILLLIILGVYRFAPLAVLVTYHGIDLEGQLKLAHTFQFFLQGLPCHQYKLSNLLSSSLFFSLHNQA